MKRFLSFLLVAVMLLGITPVVSYAAGEILYQDDYESVTPGEKPVYTNEGWGGDTAAGTATQIFVEQETEENRALKMQTIGANQSGVLDFLVLHTLSFRTGDVLTFGTRAKTSNANGYKQFFIRGASAGLKFPLVEFSGGNRLLVLGEPVMYYEYDTWYDIGLKLHESTKKVEVYINNAYKGSMALTSVDFLGEVSLRVTVNGDTTQGAVSDLYMDNTYFGKGDALPDFSEGGAGGSGEKVVLCIGNPKATVNGEIKYLEATNTITPLVVKGQTLLPLRAVTETLGGSITWNDSENCAEISLDDRTVQVYPSERRATVDGENVSFSGRVDTINDSIYVPEELAEICFNKEVTVGYSGWISLTAPGSNVNNVVMEDAMRKMIFPRPTKEQILEDFQNNPNKSHPRVLFDSKGLEHIKQNVVQDENCILWYQDIKKNADVILNKPLLQYEFIQLDILLDVARAAIDNIMYTGLVYLIEGDEKYAERAWKELDNITSFENWHPEHFLDTGEMTFAAAVGYDWLYDYMSEAQRKKVSQGIINLGLKAAESAYDGTASFDASVSGAQHNRLGWTNDYSNWGFVCNGGISAGACAIMDDSNKDYCAQILASSLKSIEAPMSVFAPDGAWTEGIGYWDYATRYMSYMLSAIEYTLGTDYNYTQVPGFANTGYCTAYHVGPGGTFNYGDAGQGAVSSSSFLWLSKKLRDPGLTRVRLNMMEMYSQPSNVLDLVFYDSNMANGIADLEKDNKFRNTETAMFSSVSGNSMANYIGLRGNNGSSGHADLDMGSVVLDALGERWAVDFGTENYNVPGYWFWPGRADYYRKRAEGHSTLVINPDASMDQAPGAVGRIEIFESGDFGGYGVVDMTDAYRGKANSARRAVGLFDDRSKFLMQDEVHCDTPSDVWWLMQTRADVEIAEDGKSAVLKKANKRVLLKMASSCKDSVFSVGPAEPFPTSPQGEGQTPNVGASRLAIKSPQVTDLNLQVVLIPYLEGQTVDTTMPAFLPMDSLIEGKVIEINKETRAKLDGILINGQPLKNFDPVQFYYNCPYEQGIYVEAIGNKEVTIQQTDGATKDGVISPVVINVKDPQGILRESTYVINFTKEALIKSEAPKNATVAPIQSVKASDFTGTDKPENTIDDNVATKWSIDQVGQIEYDLGAERNVSAIGGVWERGNVFWYKYDILLSKDGQNWEVGFSGLSSGATTDMEYLWLAEPMTARYVRLAVRGTGAGEHTGLFETKIYCDGESGQLIENYETAEP